MVGTIKQKLYIAGIPKGMTMTITALNLLPPNPPKEWRATLYDIQERQRVAPFSVDPSVNNGFLGMVKMYGAHAFPTNSDGARLEIMWKLDGTAAPPNTTFDVESHRHVQKPHDKEYDHTPFKPDDAEPEPRSEEDGPPVDPLDPASWPTKVEDLVDATAADEPVRTGRLLVETTRWGLVQRPDYVSVLYQVGSETPLRIQSAVAATIIGMPKDAIFVIGANTETQKIGINATQERDVADTMASYTIKGIFWIHEKAFGWVLGKFLPW